MGAHLRHSHIFSFIFDNHFFEQILFLGVAFLGRFNGLLLLVGIEIVEVDFVVVLVFKSVKGTVRPFFQQKLGQV